MLIALFADLERASQQDDAHKCRRALDRFAQAPESHLIVENRQVYLSRHNHGDPDVARRVDMMSTDMVHVGRILQRFITTYLRAPLTTDQLISPRLDSRAVGEVLAHRIHGEEAVLYPLYAPPAAGVVEFVRRRERRLRQTTVAGKH